MMNRRQTLKAIAATAMLPQPSPGDCEIIERHLRDGTPLEAGTYRVWRTIEVMDASQLAAIDPLRRTIEFECQNGFNGPLFRIKR
jgi:hypothetical protein